MSSNSNFFQVFRGGGVNSGSNSGGNYPSSEAIQQQQQHNETGMGTSNLNNHKSSGIVFVDDENDNMMIHHNSPLDTPHYSYVSSSSSSVSSSSLSSCAADNNNNDSGDFCNLFGRNIMTNLVDDPYCNDTSNGNPTKSLQDAEKTLTEELYGMTLKEREGALHDIHGVSDYYQEKEENIDFIRNCKQELENEIQQLLLNNNSNNNTTTDSGGGGGTGSGNGIGSGIEALQIAINQSPNYVRGVYLMFLRCEEYRIVDAAKRMIRHFELKRELWGVNKLGRDITLDDFDHFDMQCLKAGFFQLLPQRDRGGRALLTKIWYHQMFHVRENVWRTLWYINQVALLDEETQKKGLVAVIYNVDPNWINTFDPILFAGVGRLIKASALRAVATHYCFLNAAFGAVIKFISTAMDRHNRTRTKLHHGNHVEVQYELMSYGIPVSALPVNSDGVMRTKEHAKWIQNRRKHEMLMMQYNSNVVGHHSNLRGVGVVGVGLFGGTSSTTSTSRGGGIIAIPSHSDVLFGRGKIFQMHVGNMKFSTLLEEKSATYFASKRNVKAAIAISIVVQMKKEYGARFLRQDEVGGLWFEVDDKTAADKVGHGFRNRKGASTTTAMTSASVVLHTEKKEKKRISSPVEEKKDDQSFGSSIADMADCVGAKRSRMIDA